MPVRQRGPTAGAVPAGGLARAPVSGTIAMPGADGAAPRVRSTGVSAVSVDLMMARISTADPRQWCVPSAPRAPRGQRDTAGLLVCALGAGHVGVGDASVDALKQLDAILETDAGAVLPHIDSLVSTLTLQMRLAFTTDAQSPDMVRLCKHLVNVLFRIFAAQNLAVGKAPCTFVGATRWNLSSRLTTV